MQDTDKGKNSFVVCLLELFLPLMTVLESEIKHSRQEDTAEILKGTTHLYANRVWFLPIEMWTPQCLQSLMGIVYFLPVYCVLLTHYLEADNFYLLIALCFVLRNGLLFVKDAFYRGRLPRQCSFHFCDYICLDR